MVILQICAYSALYGGNFIASLIALDKAVTQKGHEVRYLFPKTASKMQWCINLAEKRKVYFAESNRFSITTYKQVKSAMQGVDIVHSHFELYDCLAAIALKKNQKLLWHLHDSFDDNIDIVHRILNVVQYRFLSKQAILVSPSAYYANYVVKIGFDSNRVAVVDNCIDLQRLNFDPVHTKKYDFLAFGGFYYVKGLDVLLNACRKLKKNTENWKLGIVGYEQTWKWIDENYSDLNNQIIRLLPQANISEYYNSAKVFISASRRETFSYALLEALYMKKTVFASQIPGTSWVSKYKIVKSFESENSEELSQMMNMYLNDGMWYSQQELDDCYKEICSKYNVHRWVDEIEGLYYGK